MKEIEQKKEELIKEDFELAEEIDSTPKPKSEIEILEAKFPGRAFLKIKRKDSGGKTLHALPYGMSDYETHNRDINFFENHYWFFGYYYKEIDQIRRERFLYVKMNEQVNELIKYHPEKVENMTGIDRALYEIVDHVTVDTNEKITWMVPTFIVMAQKVF